MAGPKFRFHVLGIPHTITDREWSACAFTMKVMKFCKMMTSKGHHVIHYGHEDSKLICSEHVPVVPRDIFDIVYGGVDWKHGFFKYDSKDLCYDTFFVNATYEIRKRFEPYDFLLLFWGYGHKPIADELRDLDHMIVVEPGIGYPLSGIVEQNHHIYESYSIMNRHLGYIEARLEIYKDQNKNARPKWYDCVIPNYFDPDDFTFDDRERTYFLYLGRISWDKGVGLAVEICEKTGQKLKIAGQGDPKRIIKRDLPDFVEFVGYANPEKRRELLAGAKGLFAASFYSEPFGGIAVEAMMTGTPVITTDWGAFPETVLHGITGFRCKTVSDFVHAVNNIHQIDRKDCREWALENYSLEKIGRMYEKYFNDLYNLHHGKGFYHVNDVEDLGWLHRCYPSCYRSDEATDEEPVGES